MEGVSVIIPVFNRADFLERALQSVLQQTHSKLEIIVVDDGSSDLPMELGPRLIKTGGKLISFPKNRGVSAARNEGIRVCSYDWIAFLDSDDLWLPEKIEKQLNFHKLRPDLLISQCKERWLRNGAFVNPKHRHRQPVESESMLEVFNRCLELCLISPSAVFLRRELLEECGYFREEMRVCEDYDLWLRIISKHRVGLLAQELLIKHGGHSDQLSGSQPAMDRFRVYSIVKLLLEQKSLLDEFKILAQYSLLKKCQILKDGAIKRGRLERLALYDKLLILAADLQSFDSVEAELKLLL